MNGFFLLAESAKNTIIHLDEQFIAEAIPQLVTTTIIVLILGFILYNPVKKFMRLRAERIANEIDSASKALKDAEQLKAEYESKLKQIDIERDEILITAKKMAHERENKIIGEAKQEASQIIKKAHLEIEREQEKAKDEIKTQIVEISVSLAKKYVAKTIDESTQNRLLEQAISDLGDAKWIG